jgi:geranylgeranylglycerol-phosphate geranylgeranyltransferase
LGVLAPVREVTFVHIATAVYVGVTLALLQGAGQAINQWSDCELDKLARPYRPLPSGTISRDEALGLAWLLAIFAVGRAFTVTVTFGLFTLILLFFSVFYSLAPFSPRKVNSLLNNAWMAVSRGFLPFLAVLSVYGKMEDALPWAVFGFLWVFAYQPTKDISDMNADKKFQIKTIPNTYGVKGLQIYMLVVTIIMWIYSAAFLPVMLLLVPLSILAVLGLNKKAKGIENNLSWVSFYVGLGISYLVMFFSNHATLLPW